MPRTHDDGNADFFDHVPELRPRLGHIFKQRLVSDFYIRSIEDTSAQFPGFTRDSHTALHGKYVFYYTILSSLPVNRCCARYIGFDPPADRIFWRGDIFVVRYEGELGSGHEYADVPVKLARSIESSIRSAYERSALEDMVEFNEKFERAVQQTVGAPLGPAMNLFN